MHEPRFTPPRELRLLESELVLKRKFRCETALSLEACSDVLHNMHRKRGTSVPLKLQFELHDGWCRFVLSPSQSTISACLAGTMRQDGDMVVVEGATGVDMTIATIAAGAALVVPIIIVVGTRNGIGTLVALWGAAILCGGFLFAWFAFMRSLLLDDLKERIPPRQLSK